MNILIVEDDREIAQLIQTCLSKEGFTCHLRFDGLNAITAYQELQPDLLILDWMLPGLDGLELCARIRQKAGGGSKDPFILMLTAKGEEMDRIIGLSTGADDYLTKPFSPRELVARVRALLRRSLRQGGQTRIYQTASFTIDPDQRCARRHYGDTPEQTLDLTALEFELLSTFVSYPGRVWNRSQLIDKLWGSDFFGDDRVVDTHVARLRKKIEPDSSNPTFIKTVIGVGYKFEDA